MKSKKFKTQTTAVTLFLQSLASIAIAIIIINDSEIFSVKTISIVIFAYFAFVIVSNLSEILMYYKKGFSHTWKNFSTILIAAGTLIFFGSNIRSAVVIVPFILTCWAIILSISSFISFMQNRKEKNSAPFRYLIACLLHLGFSIPFLIKACQNIEISNRLMSVYLILMGTTLFLDALAQITPNKFVNQIKNRIKIAPPALLTVLLPLELLNNVNEFFKPNLDDEPIRIRKSDLKANVEVLLHFSEGLKGTAGHVDLVIDGTVVCYGAYDKEDIKLGGIVGAGVFYEVYKKDEYLNYCRNFREQTIFGFELALSDEELAKVKEKLAEIKGRADVWKCKAQRAKERNEDCSQFTQPPCLLSKATETVFYKINSGKYKHYWILGENCVKFVDEILRSSGIKTIFSGIITPGTYYTFLDNEFLKGNSFIVGKNVYTPKIKE